MNYFIFQVEDTISIKQSEKYRRKSLLFICCFLTAYFFIYVYDLLSWHLKYQKIDSIDVLFKAYLPYYFLKFIMLNQILLFCHMVYLLKIWLFCLNDYLSKSATDETASRLNFNNGEIKIISGSTKKNISNKSK